MLERTLFVVIYMLLVNIALSSGALPSQGTCGTPTTSPSIDGNTLNRIINGQNAVSNSWPWQVSIRYYDPSTKRISDHFCGGTLIYQDLVLTAAHCVDSYAAENLAVLVGIKNIETEAASTANTHYVSSRYYHESYNGDSIVVGNDIAILVLASNVTLSDTIKLACLPSASTDSTNVLNKNTVTTGWGSTTGSNSNSATTLQQATLSVINGNICKSTIEYADNYLYCALASSRTTNVCFGDSGGPLVYYTNSKWYIYGVVSFVIVYSNGNCDYTRPSYFTKVPAYLSWIEYGYLNFTRTGQVQENQANQVVYSAYVIVPAVFISLLLSILDSIF